MMRTGMFGPGFALPGDPPGSLTLADFVFWAVFTGDLDRAEELIAKSEVGHESSEAAAATDPAQAPRHFSAPVYPYVYTWNRMGRKGQRCAVLVRGKMNSCSVEFEDGFQAVTSRNAIRKFTP
jgi:hypothetical protein